MNESILNYSWRVGRLFDTEIRIHWMLPAMLLFFLMRSPLYQAGAWELLLVLVALPWLLLFQSVLMHEFGHVFAARRYHMPCHEIILTPIGGLAVIGAQARTPRIEFIVAAAGPAVNVGLFLIGTLVYLLLGGVFHIGMALPFIASSEAAIGVFNNSLGMWVLYDFICLQSILVLFNVCMMAYPMDGGRMLMALLWQRMGHGRAMFLSLKIAQGFAFLMGGAALWFRQPILIVIAIFIFIQATQMLKRLPYMSDPGYAPDMRFEQLAWEQRSRQATQTRRSTPRPGPIVRWVNRVKAKREIKRAERQLTTRAKVDELLDKITAEGISSLSDEEKAYLKEASQQYQGSANPPP